MAIEVEKRAVITKDQYATLPTELLAAGAEDHGANDTRTIFYVTDDAQLKLQIRNAQQTAKLAWKAGGLDGSSARQEIEVGISFDDTKAAEQLIDRLLPNARKVPTAQQRHDYQLDTISIALKYSEHWSYHIEIDEVVEDEAEIGPALARIEALAKKLGITLFTPEQEKAFVAEMVAKL